MAIVLIPVIFRGPTQGESSISVPNGTIEACFGAVEARFPGLRELVIDPETGGIHRFVKVSLNGEMLDHSPKALQAEVGETDEIEVIAAIAGG
jgi:molybdopterin synthase sulfur carrier subunit